MYRTIDTSFWTDPKVLSLPANGKLLLLYLVTNPHSHVAGIYYLPALLVEHETGLQRRALDTLRNTLSGARLALFDGPLSVVWVRRMFHYQGRGEKNERAAAAQLRNLHGSRLIASFLDEYPAVSRWCSGYPIDRGSGSGTQDQDQDQDQDSDPSSVPVTPHALPDSGSDAGAHVAPAMPAQSPIPQSLGTAAFLAAWQEFREWRTRQKHKRMTAKAEQLTLAQLEPYGAAVAVEALQASMRNDWQGVFPEKASNGGNGHRRPGPIIAQRDDSGAANTVTITRGRRGV